MIVVDPRETEAAARQPRVEVSQLRGMAARHPKGGTIRQVLGRAVTRALVHEPMLRMRQVGLGGY